MNCENCPYYDKGNDFCLCRETVYPCEEDEINEILSDIEI